MSLTTQPARIPTMKRPRSNSFDAPSRTPLRASLFTSTSTAKHSKSFTATLPATLHNHCAITRMVRCAGSCGESTTTIADSFSRADGDRTHDRGIMRCTRSVQYVFYVHLVTP
jgi:hypothetical protein